MSKFINIVNGSPQRCSEGKDILTYDSKRDAVRDCKYPAVALSVDEYKEYLSKLMTEVGGLA